MNTPVNFELAKLLKEKGWDKPTDSRWFYDTEYFTYRFSSEGATKWTPKEENSYPAPTIAEVVMWLYEKHQIYVFADPVYDFSSWTPRIYKKGSNNDLFKGVYEYSDMNTAYEAAIEYTLTKILTP